MAPEILDSQLYAQQGPVSITVHHEHQPGQVAGLEWRGWPRIASHPSERGLVPISAHLVTVLGHNAQCERHRLRDGIPNHVQEHSQAAVVSVASVSLRAQLPLRPELVEDICIILATTRSMHTMRRVLVMVRTTTLLIEYACCMHTTRTMDSVHTPRVVSVMLLYSLHNMHTTQEVS